MKAKIQKVDTYNYRERLNFEELLKLFEKDNRFIYPLAISIAYSVINQNIDSNKNKWSKKITDNDELAQKWISKEEQTMLASATCEDVKNILSNYNVIIDNVDNNGMNKRIVSLKSDLGQICRVLTLLSEENEKSFPHFKEVTKVNRKTGKITKTEKHISLDEYYNLYDFNNIMKSCPNLYSSIAFDIVQDIALYLFEAWTEYHKKGKNWLNTVIVETKQKRKTFSEKEYQNGKKALDKTNEKDKTTTVIKKAYSAGNKTLTQERAIREQTVLFVDLFDTDNDNEENHYFLKSIGGQSEDRQTAIDTKVLFNALTKKCKEQNLPIAYIETLKAQYYGIKPKKSAFIFNPTKAELARYFNVHLDTINRRFRRLQELSMQIDVFKKAIAISAIKVYMDKESQKNVKMSIDEIDIDSGKVIAHFESIGQCAEKTGITKAAISYCVNGKRKLASKRKFVYHVDDVLAIDSEKYSFKFGKHLSKETVLPEVIVKPKKGKKKRKTTYSPDVCFVGEKHKSGNIDNLPKYTIYTNDCGEVEKVETTMPKREYLAPINFDDMEYIISYDKNGIVHYCYTNKYKHSVKAKLFASVKSDYSVLENNIKMKKEYSNIPEYSYIVFRLHPGISGKNKMKKITTFENGIDADNFAKKSKKKYIVRRVKK